MEEYSETKKKDLTMTQRKLANEIGITVVKLQRDEVTDELGFSLCYDGTHCVNLVGEVEAESMTGKEGIIQPGDRIIWINRKNVEELSFEDTLEILEKAPNGSSMVLTRWNKDKRIQQKGSTSETLKEQQLIPNLIPTEEPYMFEVTYLPQ